MSHEALNKKMDKMFARVSGEDLAKELEKKGYSFVDANCPEVLDDMHVAHSGIERVPAPGMTYPTAGESNYAMAA